MSYLDVAGLGKFFDTTTVFDGINFSLEEGEFVTLLGPSGCGKSTLLRCLAGLTAADRGTITMNGIDITRHAPQQRGIGMVFQHYALFPNMTVAQNIAFGLKMQACARDETAHRVNEIIALVELIGHEHKSIDQLSGGQQQRVALARALVVRPRILLLDEPLSALDARIRKKLQEEIRRIQRHLRLTTIFVTHDQEEALLLSDRIFVMHEGRIVQADAAERVYTRPANAFVAGFIGNFNVLNASQATTLLGRPINGAMAIRPETIQLDIDHADAVSDTTRRDRDPAQPSTQGSIDDHQLLGNVIRYRVTTPVGKLMVDVLNRSSDQLLPAGTAVQMFFENKELRSLN